MRRKLNFLFSSVQSSSEFNWFHSSSFHLPLPSLLSLSLSLSLSLYILYQQLQRTEQHCTGVTFTFEQIVHPPEKEEEDDDDHKQDQEDKQEAKEEEEEEVSEEERVNALYQQFRRMFGLDSDATVNEEERQKCILTHNLLSLTHTHSPFLSHSITHTLTHCLYYPSPSFLSITSPAISPRSLL